MENNEDPNKDKTKQEGEPVVPPVEKSVSIVEEAKAIRDEILKAKEELQAENDRKDARDAQEALGGGSDSGQVEPQKKQETDEEFTERFERGEVDLLEKT